MRVNEHYKDLQESYLFSTIARKVSAYQAAHQEADIVRLGIGDVTRPLCPAVVEAMTQAVREMGEAATFRGYGPEQGYDFLRDAVKEEYAGRGVALERDEIFISDGAKSDVGNILDLFDRDNAVLVPDPVYPVYVDTNLMAGRTILYLDAGEENGFLPMPDPSVRADLIYLCSPNNPTGAVYTREQLRQWVDYARECGGIILFDAAYEAFVADAALPRSILEIPGARECAVEFCSLSKTAGFTGTRCAYTVVPKQLCRNGVSLNGYWARRQATKFNGVSYIVQRGAQAVYSEAGQAQIRETIAYYQENAKIIREGLAAAGFTAYGGVNAPYIWLKCPDGLKSWDLFDLLINRVYVVGTPGQGFGEQGEGYFRLTAFGTRENTCKAVERIKSLF